MDFVRTVVGSNPSHGEDRDSHPVHSLASVLKSRQPQSVPTMPKSPWWNHLSDHPLVQWGTRGASQEASLPKGAIKQKLTILTLFSFNYFNIILFDLFTLF